MEGREQGQSQNPVIRNTYIYIHFVYREGIEIENRQHTWWGVERRSVYPYDETTRLARHYIATGYWSRWARRRRGRGARGIHMYRVAKLR